MGRTRGRVRLSKGKVAYALGTGRPSSQAGVAVPIPGYGGGDLNNGVSGRGEETFHNEWPPRERGK